LTPYAAQRNTAPTYFLSLRVKNKGRAFSYTDKPAFLGNYLPVPAWQYGFCSIFAMIAEYQRHVCHYSYSWKSYEYTGKAVIGKYLALIGIPDQTLKNT
jgi:hypothetical protein